MFWSTFIASLIFTLVSCEKVIDYKDGTIDLKDGKHNYFVEFFAPWCGHCKQLAPKWEELASTLHDLSVESKAIPDVIKHLGSDEEAQMWRELAKTLKVVKVDATEAKELANEYQVAAYPTIKLILKDKGTVVDYKEGRETEAMFNYLMKKLGPAATEIKEVERLQKLVESNEIMAFGYFKNPKDFPFKEFLEVAHDLNEAIPFYYTHDAALAKEYKIDTGKHDNAIILFRKFDDGPVYHYDKFDDDDIAFFIKSNKMPLVSEFNQENANKIFTEEHQKHILLFENKTAPGHEKNMERFRQASKEIKGKVLFVYIDSGEDTNARILEFFGIKTEELPTIRIINLAGEMKKYKPDSSRDPKDSSLILPSSDIVKFVNDFLDGKLKVHLLSEELPEDWDKQPVKVLVSNNFHEHAYDPKKAVLVEFYATWCGHCKQLEPIYNDLGEEFEKNADIMIAKVNSPSNEIENLTVRSFPTIKYFRKLKEGEETKKVIEFTGERTLKALKDFVESEGEVNGPAPTEGEEAEGEETDYDEDEDMAGGEHGHEHEHTEL